MPPFSPILGESVGEKMVFKRKHFFPFLLFFFFFFSDRVIIKYTPNSHTEVRELCRRVAQSIAVDEKGKKSSPSSLNRLNYFKEDADPGQIGAEKAAFYRSPRRNE